MIRILALAAALAVALVAIAAILSAGDDSILVPPPEEVAVSFLRQLGAARYAKALTYLSRERTWGPRDLALYAADLEKHHGRIEQVHSGQCGVRGNEAKATGDRPDGSRRGDVELHPDSTRVAVEDRGVAADALMEMLTLKRLDDGRLISVEASEPDAAAPEKSPYEAGYRRIVAERELPAGRARIFESGGSFVLIVREAGRARAFDARPLMQAERTLHLLRSQQFSIETQRQAGEVQRLVPLAAVVDDGWIWVDVETRIAQ